MNHGWKYITSEECFSSITPKCKIEKKKYSTGSLIPIISQEEEFISGYWDDYSDITPHSKPVVVFGDHSRVLKYIDFDFVVGADGVKILHPSELIEAKFLYYYLRWKNIPSLGYSRHFKLIKDSTYLCPPLNSQHAIVTELDKLNELIESKRKQLKDLDTLAQSLFYETFGDPIENPKGWETVLLEECVSDKCSISYGIVQPGDDMANGTPIVRPVDFGTNRYVFNENLKHISPDISESYKRTILNGDEILICVRGTTGLVKLSHTSLSGANVTRGIVPIQIKSSLSKIYIYEYLKRERAQSYIQLYTKGIALKQINLSDLRSLPILLPPLSLQNEFATRIEAIEAQKRLIESTIADLETLLASRMDYWFND